MAKENNYGNIYEIKLPNNKYVYVCWIREFSFGVFDYLSKEPTNEIDKLSTKGIKIFKACKETAIKKKIWKLIGQIDLAKENIEWPDLANYRFWDIEGSIEASRVMRHGNPQVVEKSKYLDLVKKGYIYGFFDKHTTFEKWIAENIEDYPNNLKIDLD